MNTVKNPFEYEGANNLQPEDIIDFYIEDYNYSRFIQSTRNVFLIGERGAGKTMTLLYNSFRIQYKKAHKEGVKPDFSKIGIHIPCNTPLFHKKEYLLLENDFKKSLICEHYLVLTIVYSIADTLSEIQEIKDSAMDLDLFEEIEYTLGVDLIHTTDFFTSLKRFAYKEIVETNKKVNKAQSDAFYEEALSFSSIVIPFLNAIKQVPLLSKTHFLLMIDDAHDMNDYQIRIVNSWIAYRDHSYFSFKIATAKYNKPRLITSTGGSILEGHDFITIDMEKSFQNEKSDFYKMAKDIIKRRLVNIGLVDVDVENFFPVNKKFEKDIMVCKEKALTVAKSKYPSGPPEKWTEYVYKYHRAIYFKDRPAKANIPPYSGFETITDISTGIIRNLLDPCYWMYDAMLSKGKDKVIKQIPPEIQNQIIIERSKKLWDIIREGLDRNVEGCSNEQAMHIFNLYDNLMVLFKRRLLEHASEPRAIVFTISQKENSEIYEKVMDLLNIARKAQILYTRIGSGKSLGKQEIYYVPNRLLFPSKGLDPHGQYSHVSLKLVDIWSACNNIAFPLSLKDEEADYIQGCLF